MAFNLIALREVSSTTEEEMDGEGKMKEILRVIASQQTSVCVGIPEEGVKVQATAEFLDLLVVEKFLSCLVVRSRSCDRIILEQDGLYLCPSCQDLQQKLENIPVDAFLLHFSYWKDNNQVEMFSRNRTRFFRKLERLFNIYF